MKHWHETHFHILHTYSMQHTWLKWRRQLCLSGLGWKGFVCAITTYAEEYTVCTAFFLYSRYFASQIFSPPRAMPKALFNPVNLALVAKRLKLFRLVRLVTKLLSCVSFWGKYKTFGVFSKLILNTKKFIFDQPIQQDESAVLSLESLPIFPLNHVSAQIVSDMTK